MSSSRAKGLKVIDEELEQVEEELFLAFSSVLSTHRQRERDRQTEDRIMNGIRTGYVPNESHTY